MCLESQCFSFELSFTRNGHLDSRRIDRNRFLGTIECHTLNAYDFHHRTPLCRRSGRMVFTWEMIDLLCLLDLFEGWWFHMLPPGGTEDTS